MHSDPEGGLTGGLIELSGAFEGMHVHTRPEGRGTTEPTETGIDHVHTTKDGNTGIDLLVFEREQTQTIIDGERIDKIRKRGSKYQVTNQAGTEVLGEHDTREEAVKQLAAIEAAKGRRR